MVEKVGVARRWEQSHCWGARAKALGQVCLVRLEQTELRQREVRAEGTGQVMQGLEGARGLGFCLEG